MLKSFPFVKTMRCLLRMFQNSVSNVHKIAKLFFCSVRYSTVFLCVQFNWQNYKSTSKFTMLSRCFNMCLPRFVAISSLVWRNFCFLVVRNSAVPLDEFLYLLVTNYCKWKKKKLNYLSVLFWMRVFVKIANCVQIVFLIQQVIVQSSWWEEVRPPPLPCGKQAFVHGGSIVLRI